MTPLEQLELWEQGKNIHNEERDECCPDFACCQTHGHWDLTLRKRFADTYRAGGDIWPMLSMSLSGLFQQVPDIAVHIAGDVKQ